MIRPAGPGDWDEVRAIFREYVDSLPAGHVCFATFTEELDQVEAGWYDCILLAFQEENIAGCVAVRGLDPRACELKRLYIRPRWRGIGIGRNLLDAVIEYAKAKQFQAICLDTMPEMSSAQALYRSAGFQVIPPYANNPAQAVCMELKLV